MFGFVVAQRPHFHDASSETAPGSTTNSEAASFFLLILSLSASAADGVDDVAGFVALPFPNETSFVLTPRKLLQAQHEWVRVYVFADPQAPHTQLPTVAAFWLRGSAQCSHFTLAAADKPPQPLQSHSPSEREGRFVKMRLR